MPKGQGFEAKLAINISLGMRWATTDLWSLLLIARHLLVKSGELRLQRCFKIDDQCKMQLNCIWENKFVNKIHDIIKGSKRTWCFLTPIDTFICKHISDGPENIGVFSSNWV